MFVSLKEIEAGVAVKDDANDPQTKDTAAAATVENAGEVSSRDTEVDDLLDSASTTLEAPLHDEEEVDDAFKTACEELSSIPTPQRKK